MFEEGRQQDLPSDLIPPLRRATMLLVAMWKFRTYLEKLVAEPFDAFTFSPTALSAYQLGNFETARKKLKAWELKP